MNDGIYFIHRVIPINTAVRMNIHNIVSGTLNAEELNIGMTLYGQREELRT